MNLEKVQQALINQLTRRFDSWVATQMAWENLPFSPPEAKPWMFFHFMPTGEQIATLGPSGVDQLEGIAQVDVNYPEGGGEQDLRATIDLLRDAFKPGYVSFDDTVVSILGRWRAGGFSSDGFYKVPFTVRWRCFLTR